MRRALVLAVLAAAALLHADGPTAAAPPFIVHEWGTFTSVVGDDGRPLEWRPFDGPGDLPAFVYTSCPGDCTIAEAPTPRGEKARLRALVRLETPVLYFYAAAPLSVSVRVAFPDGRLTEWYPQARSPAGALVWDHVRLEPGARLPLPDDGGPRHYFEARATDAVDVTVEGRGGSQSERFLFYRGVGRIEAPAWVAPGRDRVTVADTSTAPVSDVVLFENRGGRVGYILAGGRGSRVLQRDALTGSVETLRADLVHILMRHGLYEKEAAAMVATWGDAWFEEGTRVFYIVPASTTDAALPLQIEPRPSELVRVLVARTEILTAERLAEVEVFVRGLPDAALGDGATRESARQTLGRFGEPALRRLLDKTPDAALRARIRQLLA